MIHASVLAHYPAVRAPAEPFAPAAPKFRTVGILGVVVWECPWLVDPRGALSELWRQDPILHADTDGRRVEQAYVSVTRPDVVKGLHLHALPDGGCGVDAQKDRFVLLRGRIRLGLVDLRGYDGTGTTSVGIACPPPRFAEVSGLPSAEVELDSALGCLRVDIPPGVAHGWIALGNEDAHVLNLVSRAYCGTQERRCDPHGPVAPGLPGWAWRGRRDG